MEKFCLIPLVWFLCPYIAFLLSADRSNSFRWLRIWLRVSCPKKVWHLPFHCAKLLPKQSGLQVQAKFLYQQSLNPKLPQDRFSTPQVVKIPIPTPESHVSTSQMMDILGVIILTIHFTCSFVQWNATPTNKQLETGLEGDLKTLDCLFRTKNHHSCSRLPLHHIH